MKMRENGGGGERHLGKVLKDRACSALSMGRCGDSFLTQEECMEEKGIRFPLISEHRTSRTAQVSAEKASVVCWSWSRGSCQEGR